MLPVLNASAEIVSLVVHHGCVLSCIYRYQKGLEQVTWCTRLCRSEPAAHWCMKSQELPIIGG